MNNFYPALLTLLLSASACAEVITDGSLGPTSSLTGPDFQITADLGQQRGGNLFHSFNQFNIAASESATFSGPAEIANIISRVTGGNVSNIDGLLRSEIAGADLFLLNPAGVLFGPNASLDISGSLHISSGDYLKLDDASQFLATPLEGEILSTAAPVAFGFLGDSRGALQLQGSQLTLDSDETLTLAANGIELDNTTVTIDQGTVQLASLASAGEVAIATGEAINETDAIIDHGDITLTNQSGVLVDGGGGGSVLMQGRDIRLHNSEVSAQTLGDMTGRGISIRTSGALELDQNASIKADTSGSGTGGDISLQVGQQLTVANSDISADTLGGGATGFIAIPVSGPNVVQDGIITSNASSAGNAGSIAIEANEIRVVNGGQIHSDTFSEGAAGSITLATGRLRIDGEGSASSTGILSIANPGSTGNAGSIAIEANKIEVVNRGQISSVTVDKGNAGSIAIEANEIEVVNSGQISSVTFDKGNAGSIAIESSEIEVVNRGRISSVTSDEGNAGSITIKVSKIEVVDEGEISSVTLDAGNAASIAIEASEIELVNGGRITSDAFQEGNAGSIAIEASTIEVVNGGHISRATYSERDDGSIALTTGRLLIDGEGGEGSVGTTGIFSNASLGPTSNAGSISIEAGEVEVVNGGGINSYTLTRRDTGIIYITAGRLLIYSGGSIGGFSPIADPNSPPTTGPILIEASEVEVGDGGQIHSLASGGGDSGIIELITERLLINGGAVYSDAISTGNAGEIVIEANQVEVVNGGRISSSTFDEGAGGLVVVIAKQGLLIDSYSADRDTGIFGSAENGSNGMAGNIAINAATLEIRGAGVIDTSTASSGNAGDVAVTAEQLLIDGEGLSGGIFSSTDSAGNAGNLRVVAGAINLRNTGLIDTSTSAAGSAGNIQVQAGVMTLTDQGSIFSQSSGSGRAGRIDIEVTKNIHLNQAAITTETIDGFDPDNPASIVMTAQNLLLANNSRISTNASGESANAGSIELAIDDSIRLFDNGRLSTESVGGGGGQITVLTEELLYLKYSAITTSVAQGAGNGGDIFVDPIFIVLDNSQIIANAFAGNGGNITLIADYIFQSQDSVISASSQLGIDGIINIEALETDVDTGEDNLSADYLRAENWAQQACYQRSGSAISSFILHQRPLRASPTNKRSYSGMW